ncbi:MAG: hypothetical protein IJH67_02050, partial [Thermoguttaceae bacterium]|nr:hypothetical protein [Thermoguttaceae bacterium]
FFFPAEYIFCGKKESLQRQNLFYLKNRTFTINFIDYHYTSERSERNYAVRRRRTKTFVLRTNTDEPARGSPLPPKKSHAEMRSRGGCSRSERKMKGDNEAII